MNFLEICQSVLDEADRDASELQDVILTPNLSPLQRKVILWVREVYEQIQQFSHHWRFHRINGTLITTVNGVEDYQVGQYATPPTRNVRDVMWDSLKVQKQGSTGWSPVIFMPYEEWVEAFNLVVGAKGRPLFFVPLPGPQEDWFRLYPTANDIYLLNADWYRTNHQLVTKDDEPLWHQDYHRILKWRALQRYASEYEVPELLGDRIKTELPLALAAFYRKYLPQVRPAPALMGNG